MTRSACFPSTAWYKIQRETVVIKLKYCLKREDLESLKRELRVWLRPIYHFQMVQKQIRILVETACCRIYGHTNNPCKVAGFLPCYDAKTSMNY
mgnify:FL=1